MRWKTMSSPKCVYCGVEIGFWETCPALGTGGTCVPNNLDEDEDPIEEVVIESYRNIYREKAGR
jgi:hypothetical protein